MGLVTALAVLLVVAYLYNRVPSGPPSKILEEGLQAHRKGNLDKAERYYKQVLKLQPGNSFAHYNLGLLSQGEKKYEEAERYYRRSLESDPTFLPAMFNLALVSEAVGKNKEAADIYRELIKIQPGSAPAHHNLGLLLVTKLNAAEEGRAELATAHRIDPRFGVP